MGVIALIPPPGEIAPNTQVVAFESDQYAARIERESEPFGRNPAGRYAIVFHPGLNVLLSILFKDKIIYDSFLTTSNISFGKGIRDELKTAYSESKEKVGIIEIIGEPPVPVKPPATKPKPQKPILRPLTQKGQTFPKQCPLDMRRSRK